MSHQTFKVCILIDENVENFYIKHYIDEINPIFNRFKNQVFNRNPGINTPNLKIYWIDSEDDKILVSCEEDFRLYIEQGKGRKIFFCSNSNTGSQKQNEPEFSSDATPMDSEEVDVRCDRKSRKSHKEDEKKRRHMKKLADKLRHYEESVRNEEERHSRKSHDKRECKNAERLDRAKRRVEQIRSIIGSIDPANLNSSFNTEESGSSTQNAATSTAPNNNEQQTPVDILLSPETTRLLSNAIAGCLQPCTVINKVLNEVFAMIPQMVPLPEDQAEQSTTDAAASANESTANTGNVAANNSTSSNISTANSEQQTTEIPKQSAGTNTSDANTPVPVKQANDEIEALFKEAAKELEKMNEIVKNSNKMESSSSMSSSITGVTQIERIYPNLSDSVISNSTLINSENSKEEEEKRDQDMTDSTVMIATPSKLERSRESSIEVHDVGSIMSDDSRDWTILSIDQEEVVQEPPPTPSEPRIVNPKTGAVPKAFAVDNASQVDSGEISVSQSKRDSIKSVSAETQTAISILSDLQQQQLQASVQKSIDIVRKSIQSIHKSAETTASPPPEEVEKSGEFKNEQVATAAAAAAVSASLPTSSYGFTQNVYPNSQPSAPPAAVFTPKPNPSPAKEKSKFAPAVIVYDPNPKINAAVHTMMQMGFTNEDNWLTQLLLNVDGDIPKALNFLTPQPKNKKP